MTLPIATVRKILPNTQSLVRQDGKIPCLALGVSLDNPRFTGESLTQVLQWCEANASECLVFIGDALYQRTYEQIHAASPETSAGAANQLAIQMEEEIGRRIVGSSRAHFQVMRLSAIRALPAFGDAHLTATQLYNENSFFRASVDRTALSYIERKQRRGVLLSDSAKALAQSATYLVEEIAYYQVLCEQGWTNEVYPGHEMPVLADILKGKVPGAPASLTQRVFIELKVASPSDISPP